MSTRVEPVMIASASKIGDDDGGKKPSGDLNKPGREHEKEVAGALKTTRSQRRKAARERRDAERAQVEAEPTESGMEAGSAGDGASGSKNCRYTGRWLSNCSFHAGKLSVSPLSRYEDPVSRDEQVADESVTVWIVWKHCQLVTKDIKSIIAFIKKSKNEFNAQLK